MQGVGNVLERVGGETLQHYAKEPSANPNGCVTENWMIRHFLVAVTGVLLAGGCGEKGDPKPIVSPSPTFKPETAAVPAARPSVDAGKTAEGQSPQPGQANDHSSPAFKGGGTPDKK